MPYTHLHLLVKHNVSGLTHIPLHRITCPYCHSCTVYVSKRSIAMKIAVSEPPSRGCEAQKRKVSCHLPHEDPKARWDLELGAVNCGPSWNSIDAWHSMV